MTKVIQSSIAILLIGIIAILSVRLNSVKNERDIQKKNVTSLLMSVEQYKTKDSLQAATVGQLQLTIEQYKQFRAEDAKLIASLNVDNNRLQSIVTAQTENYYQHTLLLRDSVKMLQNGTTDSIQPVIIKTADYADAWHNLKLMIEGDSVNYTLHTRESILITNHVIPKRFLGFLWKYGVKEIKTEAVSRNPYTTELLIESITIR